MQPLVSRTSLALGVRLAFVGATCFAAAHASNRLGFPIGRLSCDWLASGAVLSVLLIGPRRDWLWVFLTTVAARLAGDLPFGLPLSTSLIVSAAMCLEAGVVSWALDRLFGAAFRVQRVSHVLVLIALGAVVSCAGAGFAALGLWIAYPDAEYFSLWWMSAATGVQGVLFVTPVILAWTSPSICPTKQSACLIELVAFLATMCAAFTAVFLLAPTNTAVLHYLPAIVSFPLLLWALLRFGYRGAVTLSLALTLITLAIALFPNAADPLIGDALIRRLLLVLFFVNVRVVFTVVFAAVVSEREEATANLKHLHEQQEAHIAARTRELHDVNSRLQSEIVERRRVEASLRESDARNRALLLAIPDMMFLHDRNGIYLVCHAANPADLFRPAGELIGKDFHAALPPEQADVLDRCCRETLATGEMHTVEYQLPILGAVRHYEARIVPCDTDKVLRIVRDITERKKSETERRLFETKIQQTQKLESLGVFAGGVAHDFNNLLTSVLGYADLALLGLPAAGDAVDCLNQVKTAARRAADLTGQMLAYSGKGRFIIQRVQLSDVVRETAALLQVSISKKCALSYHFEELLPPIEVDPTQLRQVAMNLILNASEAQNDSPGAVRVSVGVRSCDRTYFADCHLADDLVEGPYVYLEVADDGCGMTPEIKARIFDPFFTTKLTGRGLGLAAVLGIMRGHHGGVKVVSELGRGTTFTVLFPAAPSNNVGAATPAREVADWRGSGVVLVVDDEESVRGLAKAMLRSLGFTVLTAVDGNSGLSLFRDNADDIRAILLDMNMPCMDGMQALRQFHDVRADVRVIMTSGYPRQEAEELFGTLDRADFLQKPYHRHELMAVMRRALQAAN